MPKKFDILHMEVEVLEGNESKGSRSIPAKEARGRVNITRLKEALTQDFTSSNNTEE